MFHIVLLWVINRVVTDIGVHDIWIAVDETTNSNGQYIANIVGKKLSAEVAGTLLASKTLKKTKNVTATSNNSIS